MRIKFNKSVSFAVLLLSFLIMYIRSKTYEELLEIDTCPVCFGRSLCNNFSQNEISMKSYGFLLKLITFTTNILGKNSVIFATWRDKEIVIKKIARNLETYEIEDKMSNINSLYTVQNIIDQMMTHANVPSGVEVLNDNFRLCPTVDKFNLFYEAFNIMEDDVDATMNLWFTLLANPEPIIMKILSEEDGWPVPKYLGSCGRALVFENSGDMLTDRLQDAWNVRADIAVQLLRAAFNFTFSHPTFAFYLTDVSPDNIAISSEGKATFIDLDHLVIVDKQATGDLPLTWNLTLWSDGYCDYCFAYSADEICTFKISDHNVFAVCREILNPHSYLIEGGLLHSPPESFLKAYPNFWTVLLQCVDPGDRTRNDDRFHYAKELLEILNTFLNA